MTSGSGSDQSGAETVAERRERLNALTAQVIGCAQRVSNSLGAGSLEKVYENALAIELRQAGLAVEQQRPLTVRYQGQTVGEFTADIPR